MKCPTLITERSAPDMAPNVTMTVAPEHQSDMKFMANSSETVITFRPAVPELIFLCEMEESKTTPSSISCSRCYKQVTLSLDGISEGTMIKMMSCTLGIEIDLSGKFVYITWRENNNGQ